MRILVTVKEVAEVGENFELDGLRVADQYPDYNLNEWDEYAVEEAVQIAEKGDDDVEVVAVTIGPKRLEEATHMVFVKGVDRVIRMWDDVPDGVDLLGITMKTRLLSVVVEDEDPDLVPTGMQTNDGSLNATDVSLVSAIGFEWATVVNAPDLDADGGVMNVRHELGNDVEELTEVDLPAVLTVQTDINESRYTSLRGIRQTQSKEIKSLALSDLGLDAATVRSDLVLTDVYEPEIESDVTYFEGDVGGQAADPATVLREKEVGA